MPASGEERIRELTQRMLRKTLYVILSKGAATAEQIIALLPNHLEYMIGLEKKGVLFASGPLTVAPGKPVGDGLTILRAASTPAAAYSLIGWWTRLCSRSSSTSCAPSRCANGP